MVKSLFAASLWATASMAAIGRPSMPIELETRTDLGSRLANIHVDRRGAVDGAVTYTYGSCSAQSHAEAHHTIAQSDDADASRLVWIIPSDVSGEGCISAWSESGKLVGRSSPQKHESLSLKKRQVCTSP